MDNIFYVISKTSMTIAKLKQQEEKKFFEMKMNLFIESMKTVFFQDEVINICKKFYRENSNVF